MDTHRHSGRTLRMIDEAKKLHAEGRAVYLVFAAENQMNYWRQQFKTYRGLKCETLQTLGMSPQELRQLRARGSWPNCVFLFDHFVLQREVYSELSALTQMIKESHRWDEPIYLPEGIEPIAGIPNRAILAASSLRTEMQARNWDLPSVVYAMESYHQERRLQDHQDIMQYLLRKVIHMCEDIRGDAMNELGSTEPDTGAWNASSTSNATYIEGMDSMIDELGKKLK